MMSNDINDEFPHFPENPVTGVVVPETDDVQGAEVDEAVEGLKEVVLCNT